MRFSQEVQFYNYVHLYIYTLYIYIYIHTHEDTGPLPHTLTKLYVLLCL